MNFRRTVFCGLLMAVILVSFSSASWAQIAVGISVRIGPPALPVYAQPICPGPGYIWTPGYWAWSDDDGYYWVPGTWVVAPVGLLWTPGYWGWGGGVYAWHAGYWGPHIGFYGGINYGFGYGGVGFVGGEWRGGAFYYNRSVTNVSVTNVSVTNVYNKTVVVNNTTVNNNVSFNGGNGGVKAEPTPQEQAAMKEQHTAPLAAQTQHQTMASQNKQNFASVNQGKPAIAATGKAGDFSSHSAVPARAAGAAYKAPAMSPKEARVASNAGNRPTNTPATTAPKTAAPNPNAAKPASNAPNAANKSNQGFRSFTPPAKSGGNTAGGNQSQSNTSHPQSAPKPQAQSHAQSAPKPEQHKSSPPPAKKSSSPPPQPHKGK